jgi:ubiquinone/menaquinone biosynthesis C-methylase UbiE
MKKIKPRVPEGGAIDDSPAMTMEQYSEIMYRQLGKEYVRFAENVMTSVDPKPGSKVLEIGPGPAWAGINLMKKRRELIIDGLEASADMIRVARANTEKEGLEGFSFIQGVAENMTGIPDDQYDLVISRDSIHHWTDPGKAFSEIKRVLKPDGKVYLHDSRRDMKPLGRLIVMVFSRFLPHNMGYHWRASIAASYTPDEISEILSSSGIDDWKVKADLMDLVIYKG